MINAAEMIEITGNTYPVKDDLKKLGARWNGMKRCWMVSPDLAEQAQAIVGRTPPKPAVAVNEPARNWSDEQKAIFAWFATGTGNLVVQARAGTGKTTTIKQAFLHAPETGKLLYAVFNKKNQKEALEKITDPRVEVKTLHSLGFYFIKNVWRNAKPDDNVEFERIAAVAPRIPDDVVTTLVRGTYHEPEWCAKDDLTCQLKSDTIHNHMNKYYYRVRGFRPMLNPRNKTVIKKTVVATGPDDALAQFNAGHAVKFECYAFQIGGRVA